MMLDKLAILLSFVCIIALLIYVEQLDDRITQLEHHPSTIGEVDSTNGFHVYNTYTNEQIKPMCGSWTETEMHLHSCTIDEIRGANEPDGSC